MSAWLVNYPEGVATTLPAERPGSVAELLSLAFSRYADRQAFSFMGSGLTFAEWERASRSLAAYLQSIGLEKGDRVAVMMPNVPQYPVAAAAILRAGLVVVNTNPLYTPRELRHQLADSGSKAIVVLENMAATLAACIVDTQVCHVVVTSVGDMLPTWKRLAIDFTVRHIRKLVPAYRLANVATWRKALRQGRRSTFSPPRIEGGDLCLLQYTGGTTGIAKGAMLTNSNVVANVLQSEAWHSPALRHVPDGEQHRMICALPLYHIFGFTVNMLLWMHIGGCNILILNARDIPAVVKELRRTRFHSFPAVNTLFAAIARHRDAAKIDWSHMRLAVGGGMAVQSAIAARWLKLTGTAICEGYGLSEASPVASCNPVLSKEYTGTIGMPLPSTEMKILLEDGADASVGERGEIAIRGPQIMEGYWQRPEETKAATTSDGFFKTGDVGIMDERGYFRVVDRKKDMINVSGFNVYPNEIEDYVLQMPGIAEVAAIGVPNGNAGEAVKLFVVKSDPSVTEADIREFSRQGLTNYKRPRYVEFRDELPKTNLGKVMRRMLRAE